MALTGAINFQVTGGQTTLFQTASVSTGNQETQIQVTVAGSTTDQAYPIAIDISELELIYLYTDGALTIETNSSSAPNDTFVFGAGGFPLVFINGMPTVDGTSQNPFDVDVTTFYLTNGTGSTVTLYGVVVQSI